MSEPAIEQSLTTADKAREAALAILKTDVARLVGAIEALIPELQGLKSRLDRIEKTLGEIAIGLGVAPR